MRRNILCRNDSIASNRFRQPNNFADFSRLSVSLRVEPVFSPQRVVLCIPTRYCRIRVRYSMSNFRSKYRRKAGRKSIYPQRTYLRRVLPERTARMDKMHIHPRHNIGRRTSDRDCRRNNFCSENRRNRNRFDGEDTHRRDRNWNYRDFGIGLLRDKFDDCPKHRKA